MKIRLVAVLTGALVLVAGCKHDDQPQVPKGKQPLESVPVCPATVTISKGEPITCELRHPSILVITGLTKAECDRDGGSYSAKAHACRGVDY
jgi:hypothetical protein